MLSLWTRFVTIVTNIYTFPIWGRVLYAHGQIFIQIVWGATVRSVIFDSQETELEHINFVFSLRK